MTNMTIVGMLAITAIAACVAQATLYWPLKSIDAGHDGLGFRRRVNTSGQKKSFQIQVNCSVASTAKAGRKGQDHAKKDRPLTRTIHDGSLAQTGRQRRHEVAQQQSRDGQAQGTCG